MLAIETMITKDNLLEIVELRAWIYEHLGIAQFLKQLYMLGYVKLRGEEVLPDQKKANEVIQSVYELDADYGFRYPPDDIVKDSYSYDVRRLTNNLTNSIGFPLRMFSHERGGVFHSSQVVSKRFGFGTDNVISVFNREGQIDLQNFFTQIGNRLKVVEEPVTSFTETNYAKE